jgi:hypothetical protein
MFCAVLYHYTDRLGAAAPRKFAYRTRAPGGADSPGAKRLPCNTNPAGSGK